MKEKKTAGLPGKEETMGQTNEAGKCLELNKITVQYGEHRILDEVSFSVTEGEWLMIIGPNGAGKSTIIKTISGEAAYTGEVVFRGRNIREYKPDMLARSIGILAQNHFVGYSFSVREVVALGRYSHKKGLFSGADDEKEEWVDKALEMTGLTGLQDHSVLKLSGGELQRTFLAQLFAQNPDILILDEPTNHLDLIYQKQVFALVSEWLKEKGRAVISVVHDLSLAKAYGSRGLLLQKGKVMVQGEMDKVFSPEALENAYSMDVYGWMRRMLGQWDKA